MRSAAKLHCQLPSVLARWRGDQRLSKKKMAANETSVLARWHREPNQLGDARIWVRAG